MDEKTIQAKNHEIRHFLILTSLSLSHTQTIQYIHAHTQPHIQQSEFTDIDINQLPSVDVQCLDTLRWKCFWDYLQCYLHYTHIHTDLLLLKIQAINMVKKIHLVFCLLNNLWALQ